MQNAHRMLHPPRQANTNTNIPQNAKKKPGHWNSHTQVPIITLRKRSLQATNTHLLSQPYLCPLVVCGPVVLVRSSPKKHPTTPGDIPVHHMHVPRTAPLSPQLILPTLSTTVDVSTTKPHNLIFHRAHMPLTHPTIHTSTQLRKPTVDVSSLAFTKPSTSIKLNPLSHPRLTLTFLVSYLVPPPSHLNFLTIHLVPPPS